VTAGPVGLVEGLGFAVREIPLPAYLDGVAFALVGSEHARERLEPSGARIPMLSSAAGQDRENALWRLAASAAGLRFGGDRYGVGAGLDYAAAVRAAICEAVARRPLPATARLLTGWDGVIPSPLHPSLDAGLDCYLFDGAGGVPLVEVVLRSAEPQREIRGLGCHPAVRGAVGAAFDGMLDKAARGEWTAPAGAPEVTEEVVLGQMVDIPEEDFGKRVRASVRTVYDGGEVCVVQCRLPGQGLSVPKAVGTAPAQLSLGFDPVRVRISRIFHENSKMRASYRTLPPVDLERLQPATQQLLARPYRDYGRTRCEHPLPRQTGRHLLPLDEAVRRRRSAAAMSAAPIQLADLARMLDLSAGITAVGRTPGGAELPLRATPSAGGLCSGDLFVLARRVDGLEPGIYYFHPGRRVLQLVNSGCPFGEVAAHTAYPDRVGEAGAIVIHVGAFRRNQWKYWERGYRMVLLDCGHLAQSVVISATALGMVAHPIIGFVDDYFNQLVRVNGVDDAVLYLTLLGEHAS
jgi:SagB-type dehydrogenase family enzyme